MYVVSAQTFESNYLLFIRSFFGILVRLEMKFIDTDRKSNLFNFSYIEKS